VSKESEYGTGVQERNARAFDKSVAPIEVSVENTAVMIEYDRTEDIEPTFRINVHDVSRDEAVSEQIRGEINDVVEQIEEKALEFGGLILNKKVTERGVEFDVRFESPPVEG
jgi:hypothetical protein